MNNLMNFVSDLFRDKELESRIHAATRRVLSTQGGRPVEGTYKKTLFLIGKESMSEKEFNLYCSAIQGAA